MIRQLLLFIVALVVVRVVLRLVDRAARGLSRPPGRRPQGQAGRSAESVPMVRDPVCGTFVVPDRAVELTDGSRRVFFCSANCRERYRARSA